MARQTHRLGGLYRHYSRLALPRSPDTPRPGEPPEPQYVTLETAFLHLFHRQAPAGVLRERSSAVLGEAGRAGEQLTAAWAAVPLAG